VGSRELHVLVFAGDCTHRIYIISDKKDELEYILGYV